MHSRLMSLLALISLATCLAAPSAGLAQQGQRSNSAPKGGAPVGGRSAPEGLTTKAKGPAGPVAADWRTVDPQNLLVIDTNRGRILVEMYPEIAPLAVAQFKALAHRNFYDGLQFFRVVDSFMDQTGDPMNNGGGGSDLPNLKGEFSFRRGPDTPFVQANQSEGRVSGYVGVIPVVSQADGLMAMTADGKVSASVQFCAGLAGVARAGDPDSGNSQFFLMRGPYPSLNGKYAAWGRVLVGEDVVQAMKVGEPVEPPRDVMLKVRVAADMPPAERPVVEVIDTRGAYFHRLLAAALATSGAGFNPCEVDVPARLRP